MQNVDIQTLEGVVLTLSAVVLVNLLIAGGTHTGESLITGQTQVTTAPVIVSTRISSIYRHGEKTFSHKQ